MESVQSQPAATPPWEDFDKSLTELRDWLTKLEKLLKTQRVTVGDIKDIELMISKDKVCHGVRHLKKMYGIVWGINQTADSELIVIFVNSMEWFCMQLPANKELHAFTNTVICTSYLYCMVVILLCFSNWWEMFFLP